MTLITKLVLVLFLFASLPFSSTATGQETSALSPTHWSTALIQSARSQIGVTLIYDGSYQQLEFPNGDVPLQRGVCTDVVIRALRDAHGFDLQAKVNADMKAHFSSYPKIWGLSRPDSNIDHRRVPNLITFFKRHGANLPLSDKPQDYLPGDIVTWMLRPGTPHMGIVSDKVDPQSGNPLIIHNIGWGTRENDILFAYDMTGHFRPENGNY
jgi:uncharacterized protein YijF (DUF1287 family)